MDNPKADKEKIVIGEKTRFVRNETQFLMTEVDGDMVMMDVQDGHYWGLNPSSADIWSILATPHNTKELTDAMMSIYDIDEPTCRNKCLSAISSMLQKKILTVYK